MSRKLVTFAMFVFGVAGFLPAQGAPRAQDPALVRMEWTIDGTKREALVHVPANAKDVPAPLVFAFHGHGGSMQNGARMFKVHELWPEAISVYMQGLPTPGAINDKEGNRSGWQFSIGSLNDRDLAFFDAVWDTLKRDYKPDLARVYCTGHSNGGGFTYLLWAARGDRFAAVAPSSSVPNREAVPLLKPKPVLHVAGEKDDLVKYPWQQATMTILRKLNGCRPEGEAWAKLATRYPSDKGTPVITFIHPGGHQPPAETPGLIVAFFKEEAGSPNLQGRSGSEPGAAKAAESAPASRPESRQVK
jgi:polyhydroxybutyrate depolymerase